MQSYVQADNQSGTQVLFRETSRVPGAMLVRVLIEGAPPEACLECVAFIAEKTGQNVIPVPVRVSSLDENAFMVVVPLFAKPVLIEARCLVGDEEIAAAMTSITPQQARRQSRINTITRNAAAHQMRLMFAQAEYEDPAVVIDRIIAFDDGTEVVRGRMFEALTSPDQNPSELVLRVLGPDGRNAAMRDIVYLGESSGPRETCPALIDHTVAFSARISSDLPAAVFWATSDAHPRDRFTGFDARALDAIRCECRDAACPADFSPKYEQWFLARRATAIELAAERNATFAHNVKFSLIVPLFETPVGFFREMAASALGQTYSNLELILVNASPNNAELAAEVELCRQRDERVKVVTLKGNRGITENTNAGIEVATGDFLCFFDHDDVLEPDILYWYAKGIEDYPETDLLYCDEDKLRDGHFANPFFKPDWNPDLLRSMNYICHMLTVRKSIVDELEPPTHEVDGPQDYHMTFRVSERARNVFHARRVLYHWRVHERSVAASATAKPHTSEIGRRVLQAHLDRCGIPATARVNADIPNTFDLDYRLESQPLVSVVIPNKDSIDVLGRCLNSIFERSTYGNYEVVIVENNSTDQATFDYYERIQREHGNVRVIVFDAQGKVNVSRANNLGVSEARGEYIVLLNNDTEVITPSWIERLLGPCMRADVGAVGAKLLYPDDVIQHAGVMFQYYGPDNLGQGTIPRNGHAYYNMFQQTQDVSALSSACLMVEKRLYEDMGGYDDEALPSDYDDVDFCMRLGQRGLLVVYEPSVELYHHESVSRRGHERDTGFVHSVGVLIDRYPERYLGSDPNISPYLKDLSRTLADIHHDVRLWHDPFAR